MGRKMRERIRFDVQFRLRRLVRRRSLELDIRYTLDFPLEYPPNISTPFPHREDFPNFLSLLFQPDDRLIEVGPMVKPRMKSKEEESR